MIDNKDHTQKYKCSPSKVVEGDYNKKVLMHAEKVSSKLWRRSYSILLSKTDREIVILIKKKR